MSATAHIVYIIQKYPKISETFIVNEMAALRRAGVKITIFVRENPGEEIVHDLIKKLNIPIYYLPDVSDFKKKIRLSFFKRYGSTKKLLSLSDLRANLPEQEYEALLQAALISPFFKKLNITHIHAHFASWATTEAYFLHKITGVPFSFTAHAKDIFHKNVDKRFLVEKMESAKYVFTVTDFNKKYLAAIAPKNRKKIIRIYNGIDLERFKFNRSKKDNKNLILGVGRLVEKKGFDNLIKACQILNKRGIKFNCQIIGEGEERPKLHGLIKKYSLKEKVFLKGAKPQAGVIKALQKATVLVLPCVVGKDGNMDALPTVILEALACGTPVISTPINGIPEIIKNGKEGILVNQRDYQELAKAIQRVILSVSLQQKLAENGYQKVKREFDLEKNVPKLKNYFTKERGDSD